MNQIIKSHLNLLENLMCVTNHSSLNGKLFSQHLSIKKIFSALEKGKQAHRILALDSTLETYIIGDIHADDQSVQNILYTTDFINRYESLNPVRLLFLGDYVDRGKKHLETLERLLKLKLKYPNHIFLLQGNHDGGLLHEDGQIDTPYRIPESDDPLHYFPFYLKAYLEKEASGDLSLLSQYLDWFSSLPLTAFIGTENGDKIIQCVHGGIPKPENEDYDYLKTLKDLTQSDRKDALGHTPADILIWSDPHQGEQDLRLNNKRFKFTEKQFDAYAKTLGIDALFRGHQVVKEGIQSHFGGKVATIFSTGNSPDTYYTHVSPKIIHLSKTLEIKEISILSKA